MSSRSSNRSARSLNSSGSLTAQVRPNGNNGPTPPISLKIVRSGVDIFSPTPEDFLDMWVKTSVDEPLREVNRLFTSTSYRSWYLREQYPVLLKEVINDDRKRVQLIHGPKGCGKVSLCYLHRYPSYGSVNVDSSERVFCFDSRVYGTMDDIQKDDGDDDDDDDDDSQ